MHLIESLAEWQAVPVRDLCVKVTSGGTPSRNEPSFYSTSGVPWLKTQEIRDEIVWDAQEHITEAGLARSSAKLLPVNTVLVAMYGATAGKLAILGAPMACNQACCALIVDPARADYRFLYYSLLAGRDALISLANGAAQQNLSVGIIAGASISIPPLPEQKAIASLLRALDDKIAVNERIANTAVDLAAVHYRALTAGATDRRTATFGEIAEAFGGGTPRSAESGYWGGDVCWATPTDITRLGAPYLMSTERKITAAGLANCASQLHPPGSILMTSRATIGRFAVNEVPTATNQGFIVVRPRAENQRWWLFHEMQARVDEMIAISNGSTFLELSRKNFKQMPVAVPQEASLNAFHAVAVPLHRRASGAMRENETLAGLRDTLLPKLISGELRIKDAERLVSDAV